MSQVKAMEGTLPLIQSSFDAMTKNPWLLVPQGVRPQAFKTWAAYQSVSNLDTPMAFLPLLAIWISEDGLHLDDAVECLASMTRPSCTSRIKFASDFTSQLGELAEAAIKARRKAEAEAEKRREQQELERKLSTESAAEREKAFEALRQWNRGDFGAMPQEAQTV